MKKISILALGLAVCATAGAQTSVLKEAEQAMKGGQEAAKVVNIITPHFPTPKPRVLRRPTTFWARHRITNTTNCSA